MARIDPQSADEPVWARTVYPVHGSDRWAVRERGYTRFLEGPSAVRSALRRWVPAQALLVGEPGAPRFHLPTEIEGDGVSRTAQRAAFRNCLLITSMFFLAGVPGVVFAAWVRFFDSEGYWGSLGLVVCGLIQLCDVRFHISRPHNLQQRAEFFYWLYRESRASRGAGVCMAMLILMGGLQWWAIQSGGGVTAAFESYGLFYGRVAEGETWRLLTGPYLHYSVGHFALNAFLFVLLGALAWAFRGSLCLLVFVAGCSVSLTAQMLFGGDVYDNAGGISGGVYALAGLALGGTLTPSARLPPGLASQLLVIVLLSTLLAELGSESAATVAHFSGLGFGLLVGAALACSGRYGQRSAATETVG